MYKNISLLIIVSLCVACTPKQKTSPVVKLEPVVKPRPPIKPVVVPDIYDKLAQDSVPEREAIRKSHRYDRSIRTSNIPGFNYFFYEPQKKESVVGFSLINKGSPRVNPKGLRKPGSRREYIFQFADRARENIHLAVNDDVDISGRFSHDNMFRELHFFPRKQLPSIIKSKQGDQLQVTLPTGERIAFDAQSKEIASGVLSEKPIDFSRDRNRRQNPGVYYKGDYLMITIAQRGEAPRRAKVWGQKKMAEVYYPAKYKQACRVSPRHLWDQRPKKGDVDPKLTMLHHSDSALFKVVEEKCRWDLSQLKAKS